jgi:Na+/H+ antiporter NhaD/arsenite permease-like protein
LDISAAALASIIALIIVVIISGIKKGVNVGILAIGFAIIVAGIFSNLNAVKVLAFFPVSLFMILVGVTFMFGIAQTNGTMEKLTVYAVRVVKGNTALIPLVVYAITSVLTTIGPGNIAAVALLAPVMMAIATRVKMSAFLMTLLVVGAANGAAFSPFAPTGIISNGLIARMADELGIAASSLNGIAWKIHMNSMLAQGLVNIGGFLILGGWTWIRRQRGKHLDINELAPRPEPFDRPQTLTIWAIFLLIVLIVFPGLPFIREALPPQLTNMVANVGSVAFILAGFLIILNAGDSERAVKAMPWSVILMVCGMTVLIEVMAQSGGLNTLVQIISSASNPVTVTGWLGFITALLSAYSSSSGGVMPMFLPMVPGFIKELGAGNPIALISSIDIGSHISDTSPLSSLGALCIACAGEQEDKPALFRKLLIWSLAMSLVGGLVCLLFFGLLGL